MSDTIKTSGVLIADGANINLEYLNNGKGLILHISDYDSETLISKSELFDLIVKLMEIYGDLK